MKLSQLTVLATVCSIAACKPSDQKVKSVRERLEAGEAVEFNKPGTRTPNCGPVTWTTIKLSGKQERDRVVLGQQSSILNAGYKFCGVIGKPVELTVYKGDTGLGQVIVNKVTLVKLESLKKSQLKGSFFAEDQGFENYKSSIRLYPDNQGIVTIVDTRYQKGTAVDEKSLRDREAEKTDNDGYAETTAEGTDISKCTSGWFDLAVPESFQDAVINGKLGSWYSIGEKNCIRQGATINIKSKVGKDEPTKGTVKVAKIKKFRLSFLDAHYFDLRGQDFAAIKAQIKQDDTRRSEWITVVDFTAKPAEVKQVTINAADIKDNDTMATVQGQVDFKAGELIVVNIIQADNTITKAQATVLSSMKLTDTTLVRIQIINGVAK